MAKAVISRVASQGSSRSTLWHCLYACNLRTMEFHATRPRNESLLLMVKQDRTLCRLSLKQTSRVCHLKVRVDLTLVWFKTNKVVSFESASLGIRRFFLFGDSKDSPRACHLAPWFLLKPAIKPLKPLHRQGCGACLCSAGAFDSRPV